MNCYFMSFLWPSTSYHQLRIVQISSSQPTFPNFPVTETREFRNSDCTKHELFTQTDVEFRESTDSEWIRMKHECFAQVGSGSRKSDSGREIIRDVLTHITGNNQGCRCILRSVNNMHLQSRVISNIFGCRDFWTLILQDRRHIFERYSADCLTWTH